VRKQLSIKKTGLILLGIENTGHCKATTRLTSHTQFCKREEGLATIVSLFCAWGFVSYWTLVYGMVAMNTWNMK